MNNDSGFITTHFISKEHSMSSNLIFNMPNLRHLCNTHMESSFSQMHLWFWIHGEIKARDVDSGDVLV